VGGGGVGRGAEGWGGGRGDWLQVCADLQMRSEARRFRGPRLSDAQMVKYLEALAERCKRDMAVLRAAVFRLEEGLQPKARPLVRAEVVRLVREATTSVAAAQGVELADVEQSWEYFSEAHVRDRGDAAAKAVVESGWKVKAAIARQLMNKKLLMDATSSMVEACKEEMPRELGRVSERLDTMDTGAMGPQAIIQVLQAQGQVAAQNIMSKAQAGRLVKEWGFDFKFISERAKDFAEADPTFLKRHKDLISSFEQLFAEEQEALFRTFIGE
jgi:hypothetical protein